MSNDLFGNDPALICRDSRGRYCTKERAEYERAKRENKLLRLQAEKYRRQAEVVIRENLRFKRELDSLREAIRNLGDNIKKN